MTTPGDTTMATVSEGAATHEGKISPYRAIRLGKLRACPSTGLFGLFATAAHEDHNPENHHEGNTNQTNSRSIHDNNPSWLNESAVYIFSIIGNRSRTRRVITGPMVTTNNEGRTQKKIGKTSFTASLAARSSAL